MSMNAPSIRTTVVGSYPVPAWLAAMPAAGNLRDAVLVVLKTQELAGIDVVTDGELSRFDVNHPETNGMIDAFVRPLAGVRTNPAAGDGIPRAAGWRGPRPARRGQP
jgi:5-methyltetrahydropteroyltriglutamate--homocysteine methyltransferase